MQFHPFGAQHEATVGDYAIAHPHTLNYGIEAIALRCELNLSQQKFIGFVCRGENVLLIANGLYGILWNDWHRFFRESQRAKCDVHIHAYLEDLSGIV